LWKNSFSSGTQKTAPSKMRKYNKHKVLSSPRSPTFKQESLHPSYRPPRQQNAPEADPKTRSISRHIPSVGCNSHPHHKD
jgi:hypothetical protein